METMDGILTDAYQPIQIQNRLQGNYLYPENSAHMNKSIIVFRVVTMLQWNQTHYLCITLCKSIINFI